jgi:hypothetical protein
MCRIQYGKTKKRDRGEQRSIEKRFQSINASSWNYRRVQKEWKSEPFILGSEMRNHQNV